jgi:hypothetical protein
MCKHKYTSPDTNFYSLDRFLELSGILFNCPGIDFFFFFLITYIAYNWSLMLYIPVG